ncbi:MAG: deoxyribose-phosphate aldolase [Thermoprotei archaeon]|nr:MAG: deoxyribose-phosphate aldolase [Thermoprotei archaeon]
MWLAKRIDHTNVKPYATLKDVEKLCREALELGVRAVCINPCYVKYAKNIVGERVLVCAAIDLPFGSSKVNVKVKAVEEAVADGADEVDYVVNIGMLKSGDLDYVEREAREVAEAAQGRNVKAIIETCYLTPEEIEAVAEKLVGTGVAFIKTNTGFGTRGATVEDVELLKKVLKGKIGIKAAGGVRDLKKALDLIDAGADIIGTSTAPQILRGQA